MTESRWYGRLMTVSFVLFALKPIIDLECLSGQAGIHVLGQRVNPAAVAGLLCLALPVVPLLRRPLSAAMRTMYGFFVIIGAFLLGKVVIGFADPALFIRFLSCAAILFLFIDALESGRRPRRGENVLFAVAIAAIAAIAVLELAGWAPVLAMDYVNGHDVARITGGYGHPLELSRVFAFVGVLALFGANRDAGKGRVVRLTAWLVLYAVLAFFVVRSTYRTGILLFFIAPVAVLLADGPLPRRFAVCVLAVLGTVLMFVYGSPSLAGPAAMFGHSGGFVLREKAPLGQENAAGIISSTDWSEQERSFGRGRGGIWKAYAAAMQRSSAVELLFGHHGAEVPGDGKVLDEPHNLGILLLFTTGVAGLVLFAGFYGVVWHRAAAACRGDRGRRAFVAAAFMIPLWFSLIAEPLRYPTFFSMLFLAVMIIVSPEKKDA